MTLVNNKVRLTALWLDFFSIFFVFKQEEILDGLFEAWQAAGVGKQSIYKGVDTYSCVTSSEYKL